MKKVKSTNIMKKISIDLFIRFTVLVVSILLSGLPVKAHIEGPLFMEHPPKTAFGLRFQNSYFAVNSYRAALSATPFIEYAPFSRFSVGVGLPSGYYNGSYLFSDLVLAAKGDLPVKNFKIVPVASVELPTGTEPATGGHTELTGAVFLEKKIPRWHFYGYPGIRYNIAQGEEDHHADGEHEISVFKPHADKELFLNAGVSYWITDKIGMDIRTTTYYEDFNEIAPKVGGGFVFQTKTESDHTFKVSIDGSYTPNGIRKGAGGGLSVYYSL
ncbi:MAG: hypothetical protein ABEH43_11130 [Flavobacteriales bacterium]